MRPALLALIAITLITAQASATPPVTYDDAPLRAVRFVDRNEGWAVGDHGCVWHTIDGGKTWERQPTGSRASLRAVQFLTPYVGYTVGRIELPNGAGSQGVVLGTTDCGATWKELSSSLLPGLEAVKFTDEKNGIVAGDSNAAFPSGVFRTEDGGRTWKMVSGKDKDLELKPGGKSGRAFRKAHWHLPLHGEHMLDAQSGWAVGDLGAILGTTDGGKTWKTLKCGGQRAAVLLVHGRSKSVPLGAVAALAREGYLCSAIVTGLANDKPLSAAIRMVGGAASAGDYLSLLFAQLSVQQRSDVPSGTAELNQRSLERFVLAIRTWRPEVIVTDVLTPDAPPEDRLTMMYLKEAFNLAADPKAFPEQIEQLGLTPHAAKKLYALAPATGEANVTIDLTEFAPELGDAVKDFVEPAAMILGSGPVPDSVGFRLVAHRLPGAENHRSLMEGIDLAEGGTARRKRLEISPVLAATNAEREKASRVRRRLDRMLADPAAAGGIEPMVVKSLDLIRGLPPDLAARAAVSVGLRLAAAGHWTAAREVFALVADRYPLYPEAVEAFRWLVRYHASGEVRRRIELGQMPIFQKAAFTELTPNVQQASHTDSLTVAPKYRFSSPEVFQKWNQYAVDQLPGLSSFGAVYRLDPGNLFPLLAARRNLDPNGRVEGDLKAFLPDAGPESREPWRMRLADEAELAAGREPKETKAAVCRYTTVKPILDGKLDDTCWQSEPEQLTTRPAPMASPALSAEARFAHDDRFLYIAVTCLHQKGKQVPKAEKRARDEDLSRHDRVEILLDLDRDYHTYYRLCVDQRGCVAEDCWGDANWNPRWFVAVEPSETSWTVEIAIPLAELTGSTPKPGSVWAMNLLRIGPGGSTESWGDPLDLTSRPESMGLLRFTKE